MRESKIVQLQAEWVTKENFAPYGQVISAAENEKLFDEEDAQLVLDQGIPRFYIMRLRPRGLRFHHILAMSNVPNVWVLWQLWIG